LCNLRTILVRAFSISGPAKGEGNLIISLSPVDMSPVDMSPDETAWVLSADGPAGSNCCVALGEMVSPRGLVKFRLRCLSAEFKRSL
jgi:hypothetical protein